MKQRALALCALSIAVIAACSDKSGDDAQAKSARPPAGAAVASSRAEPGAARSVRGMSVTLAASDVTTVQKQTIERGISITGDLRPIERVEIRARIEGDLLKVNVREGQRVAAGAVLAVFESLQQESARQSAEADRVAAKTALSTAQWNYDQSKELFKEGAIAERDLRAAEQQLVAARAGLAAADARLRAALDTFRDTRVTAPVAGVIETRDVAPGEHVARGAPLFTLVRNDVLELAAAVPASQATGLQLGQTVRFSAGNRTVIGRVARISPTVDPASRAITVYVQVPNRDNSLRGGTFATGQLVLSRDSAAIAIPTSAVRSRADSGEPFVYRITAGELEQAAIQLGYNDTDSGLVEVVKGLNVGDRIVVGNVGTLGRGMKVQVVGGESTRR